MKQALNYSRASSLADRLACYKNQVRKYKSGSLLFRKAFLIFRLLAAAFVLFQVQMAHAKDIYLPLPASERNVLVEISQNINGITPLSIGACANGERGYWFDCVYEPVDYDEIEKNTIHQGHVSSIELHSCCPQKNYSGSLPSSLSALTELRKIDASHVNLSGSFPALTGLTKLTSVYLHDNQLTGPIPSLSGLSALQAFSVGNNKIIGPLPSFSDIVEIVGIDLRNNRLTGTIPSLSNLKKLEFFDVGNGVGAI